MDLGYLRRRHGTHHRQPHHAGLLRENRPSGATRLQLGLPVADHTVRAPWPHLRLLLDQRQRNRRVWRPVRHDCQPERHARRRDRMDPQPLLLPDQQRQLGNNGRLQQARSPPGAAGLQERPRDAQGRSDHHLDAAPKKHRVGQDDLRPRSVLQPPFRRPSAVYVHDVPHRPRVPRVAQRRVHEHRLLAHGTAAAVPTPGVLWHPPRVQQHHLRRRRVLRRKPEPVRE